jgi:HK97 family phage portal protein
LSIFRRIFRPRVKNQIYYPGYGDHISIFGSTASGKVVNEHTAMQTTAVYACVRILAESLAGLPIHIYRRGEDGSREKAHDHPLAFLLHSQPNPDMTSFAFRETLMHHILIYGNGYAQIIRDGRGRALSLVPLPPNNISVARNDKGEIFYTLDPHGNAKKLRKDEVFHIPALGFDGLIGYSPIAMAKNAIGMALAAEEYGATFFGNGANPGGVLEHPGVVKDPKRVRDSWNAAYMGTKNANKIVVLEEGMKYHTIGIPPDQAQFLETRRFQLNEIARIFRVPPHMVGDLEKSSFSNIEQQSLEFVKYTLDPWVIRWEQGLQNALLLPSERSAYFIKLNVDALLRGDYTKRMSGYAAGRQNGWLSANDIRELEDMNRIPADEGGDLYLVNGNLCKMAEAGLFAKKNQTTTENKI